MGSYEAQVDLDMTAETLWDVIRNFGDVGWLPGRPEPIFEGEGPGMIRRVIIPPLLSAAVEQLDAIDEETQQIHYRVIEGNPMPLRDYSASMQVAKLEERRSRLIWRSTWEPDGVSEDVARDSVEQLYSTILGKSKRYLEKRETR